VKSKYPRIWAFSTSQHSCYMSITSDLDVDQILFLMDLLMDLFIIPFPTKESNLQRSCLFTLRLIKPISNLKRHNPFFENTDTWACILIIAAFMLKPRRRNRHSLFWFIVNTGVSYITGWSWSRRIEIFSPVFFSGFYFFGIAFRKSKRPEFLVALSWSWARTKHRAHKRYVHCHWFFLFSPDKNPLYCPILSTHADCSIVWSIDLVLEMNEFLDMDLYRSMFPQTIENDNLYW
jgi:hypothetical protein